MADGGGGCSWLMKFVVDVFIIILMSWKKKNNIEPPFLMSVKR